MYSVKLVVTLSMIYYSLIKHRPMPRQLKDHIEVDQTFIQADCINILIPLIFYFSYYILVI